MLKRVLQGTSFAPVVAVAVFLLAAADGATAQTSLALTKTADPTTYTTAGEEITYTYLVTNDGTNTFFDFGFVFVEDDELGFICDVPLPLDPGESETCTATYTIRKKDVRDQRTIVNTAIARGNTCGECSNVESPPATATVRFVGTPDWTLTKAASPTTYNGPGETITYTYVLTNIGDVDILSFDLNDDVIGEVGVCSASSIPVGGSATCTADHITTEEDVAAGRIRNTAIASGTPAAGQLADVSDSAVVRFSAGPSWTLNKSADPRTYRGAGEAIAYSYVLRNTGNVAISAISLTDDKVASVDCPSDTLAAGAEMTCAATYITTAADVAAQSVTNVATATGTPAQGRLPRLTDEETITFRAPPGGSITIVKSATDGDGTFSFGASGPGVSPFSLTTAGGTASRTFPQLASGNYTFTEVDLPLSWTLRDLSCSGDAGGRPTSVDVASRTARIGLDGGEAIVCTFANVFDEKNHRKITKRRIADFLKHRATRLAEGPDRIRIFRRIPGALWGDATDGGDSSASSEPVAFSASGEDGPLQISAATSLHQLSELAARAADSRAQLPTPEFDVWAEAHFSEYDDAGTRGSTDGTFGIVYTGIDYLVTPSVIVGALAQFDWTSEDSSDGSSAEGFGVMAGPYLSARLTPNLFFTTRAAYGGSDNTIDPFGLYEDDFSGSRWLASAELTGNWNFDAWRFTPGAKITYVSEEQDAYTDSLGVRITDQTVSLGQMTFGPEVAYRYLLDGGMALEPHLALTGIWEFDSPDSGSLSGLTSSEEDLRAMVKAGVLALSPGGASFRIVGSYDGIGADEYDSYGAEAWISIPLR